MANLNLKFGLKFIDVITPSVNPGIGFTNKDCKESFKKLWGHYPSKHWYPQPWTEPTLYALASSLARVVAK